MSTPPNAPPPPGGYGGYGAPAPGPPVNNYLVPSILVTLFCCLPLGIAAIVNAAKVNGLLAQGDYQGAQSAADAAKKWWKLGLIIGVVVNVLLIILYIILIAAASTVSTTP